MSHKKRIAVITSSRADFGHLYWPLQHLRECPDFELRLIVMAAHLSTEFGHTIDEIKSEGFKVDETIECLLSSDTDVGMAKTIGVAVLGLADVLGRMRPDILLLIADRYEMLAPASVALALRIPVAHIDDPTMGCAHVENRRDAGIEMGQMGSADTLLIIGW